MTMNGESKMSTGDSPYRRATLGTAKSSGLDLEGIPMKLFDKSKQLAWDPRDIPYESDRDDWAQLSDLQRYALSGLTTLFQGGEESVVGDLLPIIAWVARRGWLAEELYFGAFLMEEARHCQFFRIWLGQVLGEDYDLSENFGPHYRRFFYEVLPEATHRLYTDDSPEALVRAVVTYNFVAEGVIAETGYFAYASQLKKVGRFKGLATAVSLLRRDESRHIRFGLYLLQRMINSDPSLWTAVQDQIQFTTPMALGSLQEHAPRFRERFGSDVPMLVPLEEIQAYGLRQMKHRMQALDRARGQTADELTASILADIEGDEPDGQHS